MAVYRSIRFNDLKAIMVEALRTFAPILKPIVAAAGVAPVHFGIIMVVNLAIGFVPAFSLALL